MRVQRDLSVLNELLQDNVKLYRQIVSVLSYLHTPSPDTKSYSQDPDVALRHFQGPNSLREAGSIHSTSSRPE